MDQNFRQAIWGDEVLTESETDSEWVWEPPGCHSPPILILLKEGAIIARLAGRGMHQAASTPQSVVSLPNLRTAQVIWISCN